MDRQSRKILKRVVADVLCLCAVGLPLLYFYLITDPYRRGFFCNDDSIRYPFKESTVPNLALYTIGLGLPIIVMCGVEMMRARDAPHRSERVFMGHRIPTWLWASYRAIGVFGFGAACSQLMTDIGKYSIGRLRPHFFDICRPDVDCSAPNMQSAYVVDFNCLAGSSSKLLRDARLSFPSGHSSFSAYTMVYLVLYLQARLHVPSFRLLRPVLQFACLMLAWGTALSRISNYKHHWSDVLFGALEGIVVATIVALFISDLFRASSSLERSHATTTDTEAEMDGPSHTTNNTNLTTFGK